VALEKKIITKSGSYFSYGDERLGQGRTNVKAFLVEHPDVTTKILDAIQEQMPEIIVPRRDAAASSTPATMPARGDVADTADDDEGDESESPNGTTELAGDSAR
jgi:recombination protein RecA